MSEPVLTFAYNHAGSDIEWGYLGSGPTNINGFRKIEPTTDTLVFTGGGIVGSLDTPTTASGSRDATIRPSNSSFVIPQLFVEENIMYHAALAGHNVNRYTMAVRVQGTATSNVYIEAWDDNSMSTTVLEILTGTTNSSNNSYINAIMTTDDPPPWSPGWGGGDTGAAYLRGTDHRVGLGGSKLSGGTLTDSTVYYNIYVRLETDCSTWHVQPVLAFRYLYT